jgi:hypothetical protein
MNEPRGCLLIAQMSSKGALTDNEDYVKGLYKTKIDVFQTKFYLQTW